MKRLYQLTLGLISVIIIGILILWILSKTIKPETIRDYLNAQLTAVTAQKILINGQVSWQLLPRPAIRISNINAGENKENSPYSIHINDLSLNLQISPLFHGKLVFNELKIDGLRARLNSERLPIENKKFIPETKLHTNTQSSSQFAINQFRLNNAQITVVKRDQELNLDNLQIRANQFNLLRESFPFQLKGNLSLSTANKKLASAQINFDGNTLSNSSHINTTTLFNQPSIKGQLTISQAKIGSILVDKLNANTLAKNGIINLKPLTMILYHGESIGDLRYDLNNNSIEINQTASNLDSSTLFTALFEKKIIKGNLDATIHVQTKLQTGSWSNNTQGKGSLTIHDGVILGFNLNHLIDEISNKINALLQTKPTDTAKDFQLSQFDNPSVFQGDTPIKLLTIEYSINKSVLTNSPILLQTERLELKGQNVLNLENKQLNGKFNAQVIFNNDKADGIQKILGGSFPLSLTGSLSQPIIAPNLAQINSQLSIAWLKKTLKKPVEVLKNQLDQINQILQPEQR